MNVIKDNRLKLNLTMKELSKKVGVSEATISRWESGDIANMKQNHIVALAKALDISPLKLLNYEMEEIEPYSESSLYKMFSCSISADITQYELISISNKIMEKYSGKKEIILLKVNGDSMNKVIPNGSIIVVDTSQKNLTTFKNGDIVVFLQNKEYSIKKFYNDTEHQKLRIQLLQQQLME